MSLLNYKNTSINYAKYDSPCFPVCEIKRGKSQALSWRDVLDELFDKKLADIPRDRLVSLT